MRILLSTLGCDKNTVDAEELLAACYEHGHVPTVDHDDAECWIVNTCCFISDATKESQDALSLACEEKKKRPNLCVVATGCLANRKKDELKRTFPLLDAVFPAGDTEGLLAFLEGRGSTGTVLDDQEALPMHARSRVISTPGAYAYLRIADGCDKRCSYCVIPYLRGPYRSVPMEEIVTQAQGFLQSGIRELILIAQETTRYGIDLYGEKRLHTLLSELAALPGDHRIRLMYCYPEEIYPALIETMAGEEKILHYLDMPIQHVDDDILRAMHRTATEDSIREVIKHLRNAMPDIALRTTLLSGFPGESDRAHEKLVSFVKEGHFDRLGVFPYSREEGTEAYDLHEQVPEETKAARKEELMRSEQEIIFAKHKALVGTKQTVYVDGYDSNEESYLGRTYRDAPDIDGICYITNGQELQIGANVDVLITDSDGYDLYGVIEDGNGRGYL